MRWGWPIELAELVKAFVLRKIEMIRQIQIEFTILTFGIEYFWEFLETESCDLTFAVSEPLYAVGPGELHPMKAFSRPLLGMVLCLARKVPNVPCFSSVVVSTFLAIEFKYCVE